MAKIYTKVGDKGQTSLVGGQKVSKDDLRIEAYGTVDELNSTLGVARAELAALAVKAPRPEALDAINADLELLQHWLFDLGSLLATLPQDRAKFQLPAITPEHATFLENRIDAATAILKPLRTFILPAGSSVSARLHVARTVARRAERCMIRMHSDLPENTVPFVNRVSDYLFVMARLCNHHLGVADVEWRKSTPVV